ncbi:type I-C CRISPR-associated protein Cas8c/Csd1 [Enterococcus cecorum]|uniref:type I-C CRISPR-associated protein Cas8c/Csd1 n=2 Tax=Enterococcus cecorum TaxID=44008 RepID=UPI000761600F|nr:type I-C CRISPR-associated protein Cas8c/Csd1 [Enterococcus cecorum]MCJ0521930.1 type I-C CRISPR-associated protein Cas8c/Csd1 [Enterococcus cecorum]MCJ0598791.1 type I-C CRISPR-associated protein Cas8c/Csd1 [Enterococcus cecorum]MDZ5547584.1 type I-C CRISPR-associated protein Cas8c/Csd1 [Enterococcus cecorum]MDZ5582629.1 type I-C CRISPR-associated protein Cas8c/Csd1 [Enterococcus cecorum]MDZ5593553.1 type I-C CRISPR-associated protein Cas8c/Csd1 [Enterococcus cecorum]
MDIFTSLLKSYDYALENGLVDVHDGNSTILLPLYHTNLRSNGKNIINVLLDKHGNFLSANFLEEDEIIIFPVTQDSIARSGKYPPSHPLVDKISYIVKGNERLHEMYVESFLNLIQGISDDNVRSFLKAIKNFIFKDDFFELIETYIQENEGKKIDIANTFLTFSINRYFSGRTVSVTDYIELHNQYIDYVESLNLPKGICNISGEEQQLTSKHRGLLGNAKLISVSNNKENYQGRFSNGEDIISVGYKTSEKIHLMLKFLLENRNTNIRLREQQYLVNWFSDDLANNSEIDYVTPSTFSISGALSVFDNANNAKLTTDVNELIGNSFIKGKQRFSDASKYYVAILDKASNGRISLKYFRELSISQLYRNLQKWQNNYTWEYFEQKSKKVVCTIPSMGQMILSSYGIENNHKLELNNDKFFKDQFQKIVMALIDGQKIPSNLEKAMEQNIKQRLKYEEKWNTVMYTALAIFHNRNEEDLKSMLDENNTNRSYLFGRLLAVLERIEDATYATGKDGNKRVTNAQKFWTSYSNNPATYMQTLLTKTQYYEQTLLNSNYGLAQKLRKEKDKIITAIHDNYLNSKELNQPLDYHFIFGYYAENNYIFTKNESEDKHND